MNFRVISGINVLVLSFGTIPSLRAAELPPRDGAIERSSPARQALPQDPRPSAADESVPPPPNPESIRTPQREAGQDPPVSIPPLPALTTPVAAPDTEPPQGLAAPTPAVPREPITIGSMVVTNGQTAIESLTADKGLKFRVYRVVALAGTDVTVENNSENVRGTVPVDQVITITDAIQHLTNQLLTSPRAVVYAARGNIWYALDQYDMAIEDYNQAAQIDPKNAIIFNNRGYCWWQLNAYDKAIADFNESIRLAPGSAPAFNNRSLLWATSPDAKYRDVLKAVKTARVLGILR